MSERYAVIAVDHARREGGGEEGDLGSPLGLLLHYHIPPEMEGQLEPGHLVVVNLRGRPVHGVVTSLSDISPVSETKPVLRVVDPRHVVSPAMMEVARWIAEHYRCTLWQALHPMLPPGASRRAVTTVGLKTESKEEEESSPLLTALGRRQQQVLSILKAAPRATMTVSRLKREYNGAPSALGTVVRDLERRGLVTSQTQLPGPRARVKDERTVRLALTPEAVEEAIVEAGTRAPLQAAALSWLLKQGALADARAVEVEAPVGGWVRLSDLYHHTGATSQTMAALAKKGLVEMGSRQVHPQPLPSASRANGKDEPPTLTAAQANAWHEIAGALQGGGDAQSFLLHGVTGSGKTEIYLRAIGMALRLGKQAVVLVPEISLTPQAVHRFASRFPGRVALIHSQLGERQQLNEWTRIREGGADIVVGSRSAVFAPLPRLGLIVVDEEHEWAYKQDTQPRYHAREVAMKRAELTQSVVVLGSATPDVSTYWQAERGGHKLLTLPVRVGRRRSRDGSERTVELPMPPMHIVDMRAELKAGNSSLFSRALQSALDTVLGKGEQAILFLNRRGSNSFVLCRECGFVPLCRRCDVPLVYHADVYGMLCHRCNAFSLSPRECSRCGSAHVRGMGSGTQRVVDEVNKLFPRARVMRWDRDTAARAGSHDVLMEGFARGDADILVGTQMIAKGLDLDRVTLVGVVNADTGLFMPDFRAPERTVQLLLQVAGRAGRRAETTHSRAIVQTFNPDHYAIEAASRYDYSGFYKGEIRFRAEHGYPPYGNLARLVFTHPSHDRCERQSEALARYLRQMIEERGLRDVEVLGPAPCFVHKIRGKYRWQLLLRGENLDPLIRDFAPPDGWTLDVDPMSLL
jgi:primosomal protein N' (replication factor Y) (superfamily II helicase)